MRNNGHSALFSVFGASANQQYKMQARQSHHVSSPYFKQLILGLWLWLDFCFTNFLDFNFMFNSAFNFEYPFNCGGYYDGALSARARGFAFCVYFH